MSLFYATLTDDDGREYDYGYCFEDHEAGAEYGCGMEYAWYPDSDVLERWHSAVGLVTVVKGFNRDNVEALEREHAAHTQELRV